jgi:hypothetical protein
MRLQYFQNNRVAPEPSLLALLLILSSFSPLTLFVGNASAAQLAARSLAITTSKTGQTGVSYTYTFSIATGANVQSIGLQACTTPIGACIPPTGQNINLGTIVIGAGWSSASAFTRTGASTTNCTAANNMSCYFRSVGLPEATGSKIMTANTQTNSSVLGSYYIRLVTYSDAGWVTAVDSGNFAYSIASQLTVNARVQEVLNFCVGTTAIDNATSTPGVDCTAISGTTVDIGVLDAGTVSISPISTNGGSSTNGIAMLRTNAQSGATVQYYAEQDTASGQLKVAGATCSGVVTTDQCINNAATAGAQAAIVAGTEAFGMTIAGVNCGSTASGYCTFTSGTNNLKQQSGYIGATTTTYGTSTGFAWLSTGSTALIASSTTVVDDEALILRLAATPGITTPTGSYTVTSTYIATATF